MCLWIAVLHCVSERIVQTVPCAVEMEAVCSSTIARVLLDLNHWIAPSGDVMELCTMIRAFARDQERARDRIRALATMDLLENFVKIWHALECHINRMLSVQDTVHVFLTTTAHALHYTVETTAINSIVLAWPIMRRNHAAMGPV